jgi:diguanylate cyclase (GGDEF)-like protein/PAS domain S-box-containing protein
MQVCELPRDEWRCLDILAEQVSLVIPDTAKHPNHRRVKTNGLDYRSLAAVSVRGHDGKMVAALIVLDRKPRRPSRSQIQTLQGIADLIEHEMTRIAVAPLPKKSAPVSVRPAEPGVDRLIYVTRATQSASDGILVTDAMTGERYANRAFVSLLGYTADEITQMGGLAKLYENKRGSLDGLNEVIDGGHWARDEQMRTKSGRLIDVSVRLDPICDDYGNVVGRVTVITDISERRQAEEALRESEARLTSLIHSIDDIVFEYGSDGKVLNVWTQDETLLTAPKDEVTGRLITELLGKEAGARYIQVIQRVMASGKPEHIECEVDVIAGRRWFLARVTPIYSGDGLCRSVCLLARDITLRKQAERELHEAERKFRSIFENAVEGIFQSTDDGRVISVNPALARIHGFDSPEHMIAEVNNVALQLYVDPKRRKEKTDIIKRQGYVSNFESEARRRDGSTVWVSENVRQVCDENGNLLYYEGTIRDITERKQAEKELREAERRYRSIFQNAAEGIFQVTPDGRFLSANPALAKIHGYDSPEQMIEEVTDIANQMLADPMVFWNEQEKIMLQGYSSLPEIEIRRRDGSTIWVSYYARVEYGEDGNVLYFEGTVQDITEKRRISTELREQREFLRSIVDTDPNLIFVKDRDGRFVMVNQATADVYGTTVDQLVGKCDADFNPDPKEVEWFLQADRAVMDTLQERFIPEEKVTDPHGNVRWLQTMKRPMLSADGKSDQILGIATDITARKQAEDALRQSEERFRRMIENASDVITVLDADGIIRYGSPAVERVLGYCVEEIVGRKICDFIHPEDLEEARSALKSGFSEPSKPVTINMRLLHKEGVWLYVESIGTNQVNTPGIEGLVLNSRDVTERRMAEQELDYLAYHDALTELPNRVLFIEQLSWAIDSAERNGHMSAVLFLDLDRFKVINDTLGHSLGDRLLKAVASRVSGAMREQDLVSRWGGDEFTMLLPVITDIQEAIRTAQRIIATLSAPFAVQDSEYYITGSVGISIYPSCGEDTETLVKNADTAMYRAKELGKNYYQLYAPSMNEGVSEKLALEQSLRRAIEREEFTLYFQPQVDAEAKEIVGVEALVRWQHPERGLVPPGDFIPLAEETGLIVPLGEWVLKTACEQGVAWRDAGYPPLRIAVNLSAHQFRRSDLVSTIARVLDETGFDPELLELELTESVLIESEQQNIDALSELSRMGIRLAIDDFGTGYSSFIYLKRYPIAAIKIDRAFVRDVTVDPNDAAITESLIAMAQNLKMGVIAEGVETQEQCGFLTDHGCHLMQGYYFSAPLPADALVSLLENRSFHVLKAA